MWRNINGKDTEIKNELIINVDIIFFFSFVFYFGNNQWLQLARKLSQSLISYLRTCKALSCLTRSWLGVSLNPFYMIWNKRWQSALSNAFPQWIHHYHCHLPFQISSSRTMGLTFMSLHAFFLSSVQTRM